MRPTALALFTVCLAAAKAADLPAQESPPSSASPSVVSPSVVLTDGVRIALAGEHFATHRHRGLAKPILYPVLGALGRPMTRSWPLADVAGEQHDHVHQKSLWFAHGAVNGIDFWSEAKHAGRIEQIGPTEIEATTDGVCLRTQNRWLGPDGALVCTDARQLRFAGDDRLRRLDYAVTLHATDARPLTFGDTKEGTMAIRLAAPLRIEGEVARGHCRNSEGHRDGAAWGKRARWVAYHGPLDGEVVGVALLDHPDNLRHPTWWHARTYGLLAANPFGMHDFEKAAEGSGDHVVAAGGRLTLHYRFVFFAGEPDAATIDGWWREFAMAGGAERR